MEINKEKEYFEVGERYFNLGETKKAIYWLKKCVDVDPFNYDAYTMTALSYLFIDKSNRVYFGVN